MLSVDDCKRAIVARQAKARALRGQRHIVPEILEELELFLAHVAGGYPLLLNAFV
jgi:hypothetical protein